MEKKRKKKEKGAVMGRDPVTTIVTLLSQIN
jgi:hypothetical protein